MAILEAAKHYASLDISVVPTTNKVPPIKWEKYKNEIMSVSEIEKYFTESQQVAIICGKVSRSMEVIDIDSKHDPTGRLYDDYCRLLNQADPTILKIVIIQKTVSGGYHFIYRCSIIAGNKKLANREDGESLIETRGEKGYFICWPSAGYELLQGSFDNIPTITVQQREILWDTARSLNRHHPKQYEPKTKPADDAPAPVGLSAGDDYDSRGEEVVIPLLEKHGWTVVAQSEGKHGTVTKLKRPGESDSAYSANFNFKPNRFWCWSTSTVFNAGESYKPYAVFAMLECGGDFKEAARRLYELDYGEQTQLDPAIKPKIFAKSMNQQTKEAPEPKAEQETECEYFRVATNYFKLISTQDLHGNQVEGIKKWNRETLVIDHGKDFFSGIPKYDSFVCRPSHLYFKKSIGNACNLYNRVTHELIMGDYSNTTTMLRHAFGDKYEIFLDYVTILWRHPTQILPIVCLVSEKRQTGKTTILKWLKAVFQKNAAILKNENFQTAFNSHYVSKLLIMIDENYVELDKKKEAERIKSMATADTDYLQMKGVDSEEIDFFGKIFMTANNKEFIKIDKEEIRYMVVEVPELKENDPDLLEKMIAEIPCFLHFITYREITHKREDRAWFKPDLLTTATLDEVVQNTRLSYEALVDDFIEECLETFVEEGDSLMMSCQDILDELLPSYRFLDAVKIRRHLKALGYKTEISQRYTFYSMTLYRRYDPEAPDAKHYETKRRGRPYIFIRKPTQNSHKKPQIIAPPTPID